MEACFGCSEKTMPILLSSSFIESTEQHAAGCLLQLGFDSFDFRFFSWAMELLYQSGFYHYCCLKSGVTKKFNHRQEAAHPLSPRPLRTAKKGPRFGKELMRWDLCTQAIVLFPTFHIRTCIYTYIHIYIVSMYFAWFCAKVR